MALLAKNIRNFLSPNRSLYQQKDRWKLVLFFLAVLIGAVSLWYTNTVVKNIQKQERNKVAIWAKAQAELLSNSSAELNFNFLFEVIESNTDIPVILTDNLTDLSTASARNLDSLKSLDTTWLRQEIQIMRKQHEPIIYSFKAADGRGFENYIFYKDSKLLTQIKYYPIYQLAFIGFFLIISYIIFSLSRKYEQDLVWVGMSKETAHQLGTPLSSLLAWIEILRGNESIDREVIEEMTKDIDRLEVITERFSKIGSNPDLKPLELNLVIEQAIEYLKKRTSKKVVFDIQNVDRCFVYLNENLFNWVIENLTKNAIDAIGAEGKIIINITQKGEHAVVDFEDTGKGIQASNVNMVFKPGFSTKKRGWGLGLTLTKRIVENYHNGKITVKSSEVLKGTTFRITLPLHKNLG